jgi:hypothetical protein
MLVRVTAMSAALPVPLGRYRSFAKGECLGDSLSSASYGRSLRCV